MQATAQQPQRAPDGAPVHYERHRPEQSTLYRLVQQHAANLNIHLHCLVLDGVYGCDADGHHLPHRIWPRAGQKVLALRGSMPRETTARQPLCADIDGFSLHAAVRVEAH